MRVDLNLLEILQLLELLELLENCSAGLLKRDDALISVRQDLWCY